MCGTVALLIRKSERRFVLIVRSHSSSVYSFHGCEGYVAALLTTTSMPPNASTVAAASGSAKSSVETSET